MRTRSRTTRYSRRIPYIQGYCKGLIANASQTSDPEESDGYYPLGSNTTVYPGAWLRVDLEEISEFTTAKTKVDKDGSTIIESEIKDLLATDSSAQRTSCVEGNQVACEKYSMKEIMVRQSNGDPVYSDASCKKGDDGCVCTSNEQGEICVRKEYQFQSVMDYACDAKDQFEYCPYYRTQDEVIDYEKEWECQNIKVESKTSFLCFGGCSEKWELRCEAKHVTPITAKRQKLNCKEDDPTASAHREIGCRRPQYLCEKWATRCTRYSVNESFMLVHEDVAPKWRPFAIRRGEYPKRFEDQIYLKFVSPKGTAKECRLDQFGRFFRGNTLFIKIPTEKNEDIPCDVPIWNAETSKALYLPKVYIKNDIHYSEMRMAAISISFLPVALYWWIRWRNPRREKFNPKAHFLIPLGGWFFTAVLWISFIDPFPLYEIDLLAENRALLICLRIVALWIALLFMSGALTPLALSFRSEEKGLRTQDFIDLRKSSASLADIFCRQNLVPIGHDVKTEDVVSLPQKKRSAHVLVIGATGTGKTNLMTNLILHAIRHRQPCVVIDPKGESSSLELIRAYGNRLSDDFESRLQVFSMSAPGSSANYNPLKHGNANQLKDRMMEAFVWSEPYYQNVSASFLTAFTACTEFLGIPLNLERVSKILLAKEERAAILKQLQERFDSGDQHALELFHLISPFFSKAKEEELSGLGAQISILNNPTFGHLLSFEKTPREIDLRQIRKTGGIAYFQLDTLGNGDSARRLGRMIIEDLKSMSSEVYKSEPNENDRIFFPIFIDEFGSFASREFIEFLKQSRGAKFGIHAFCQGLEDMDAVTPEFRRQVISNTMTKIGLRMDDHETVEAFCATAGTFDTLKQSYQVSGELIANRTGMGNMREAKQMQIEHDVLKQLKIGQAVVIEKSPSRVRGLQIPLFEDIMKSL